MDYVDLAPTAAAGDKSRDAAESWPIERLRGEIYKVREDMLRAANELRFEEAAKWRDRLATLERIELSR